MSARTQKSKARIPNHVTKKTIKQPGEINILTYNLCWGCMTANDKSKFDRTAEYLAVKCQHALLTSKQHQCATNIINNIALAFAKNTRSGKCDILAMQEATNWRLVYDGLKAHKLSTRAGLAELGYIHHLTRTETGALAELCTLYNRTRFQLKSVVIGDIGNGRPFQIIRLWCRVLRQELIVINIHNSHHGSANIIQAALNNTSAQKLFTISPSNDPSNGCLDAGIWEPSTTPSTTDLVMLRHNMQTTKKSKLILFMGDTNDHGRFKLWRGFIPFPMMQCAGDKPNYLKVSTQSRIPPAKSCCAPVGNSANIRTGLQDQDFTYGDYILASDNLKFLVNNKIPTVGINHDATYYPASDHLPVLATVVPRHQPN